AGVIAAAGLLGYVASRAPGDRGTEFFILGPDGNASAYPTTLKVSQSGKVVLRIVNFESAIVAYAVRIDLIGLRVVYNASSRSNDTVEVNRTTTSNFDVTLANGANWTHDYIF